MRHSTYVGPDPVLKDQSALVRDTEPRGPEPYVLAQFDDLNLWRICFYLTGLSWVPFPASDFVDDRGTAQ